MRIGEPDYFLAGVTRCSGKATWPIFAALKVDGPRPFFVTIKSTAVMPAVLVVDYGWPFCTTVIVRPPR